MVLPHAHTARVSGVRGQQIGSARLVWRTVEERRQAPPKVRILIVVAEALRSVSSAPADPCSEMGLRTRIGQVNLSGMHDMRN